MGWYDEDWPFRLPISVVNDGGGGGSDDVTIALPGDLQHLQDHALSNGDDIRVTGPSGGDLQVYDLNGYADGTGTIEVQAVTMETSACTQLLWLYYGNAGATDAKTPFTPTTPLTGHVWSAAPLDEWRIRPTREAPGVTAPSHEFAKSTVESGWLWFLISPFLHQYRDAFKGSSIYEEVDFVNNADMIFNGGADATSTYCDPTATRFVVDSEGFWVGIKLSAAGASGDTVTVRPSIITSFAASSRVVNPRCLVTITDADDQ